MTVAELITQLKELPQDFTVLVWDMGQGGLVSCYIDRLDQDDPEMQSIVIDAVQEGGPLE